MRLGRSNGLVVMAVAGVCSKYGQVVFLAQTVPFLVLTICFQGELFCLTTVPFVLAKIVPVKRTVNERFERSWNGVFVRSDH